MGVDLEGDEIMRTEGAKTPIYWIQKEINSNTYVVVFAPPIEENESPNIFVEVWAKPDGGKHSLPEKPFDLGSSIKNDPHKNLVRKRMKKYKFFRNETSFSEFISEAINSAVCELEGKQSQEQKFSDEVLAAIEANREVHGGIDYQLEGDS
jgi:hypothetical protein